MQMVIYVVGNVYGDVYSEWIRVDVDKSQAIYVDINYIQRGWIWFKYDVYIIEEDFIYDIYVYCILSWIRAEVESVKRLYRRELSIYFFPCYICICILVYELVLYIIGGRNV